MIFLLLFARLFVPLARFFVEKDETLHTTEPLAGSKCLAVYHRHSGGDILCAPSFCVGSRHYANSNSRHHHAYDGTDAYNG